MRIIVAHEKHATRYLDATTTEDWAASALKLLTQRWKMGHWYMDPATMYPETPIMTEEELDALPEHLQRDARRANARAKTSKAERLSAEVWWTDAQKVVETQDLGCYTIGRGKHERQVPKAWDLLDQRSDYEYERVELETVEHAN